MSNKILIQKALEKIESAVRDLETIWDETKKGQTDCIWADVDVLLCDDFNIREFNPHKDYIALKDGGADICAYIEGVAEQGGKMIIFDLKSKKAITIYNWKYEK